MRGNPHPVRTDEEGYALLGNLPVRRHVDVELELSSLPDPQWMAQKPGLQLLARPGRVAEIDVPVVLSTEITGKVFLHQRLQRRGIGDAIVELVDARGEIVAETRSAADGVYVISNVAAGDYVLRISPAQAQRLRLDATPARSMKVTGESYLIEQQDFELSVAE